MQKQSSQLADDDLRGGVDWRQSGCCRWKEKQALKKAINVAFLLLSIGLIVGMFGCKQNPTGPQITPNVQLSLDYTACTEVWLKIGFTDSPGGGDYRIDRDGSTVLTGTFTGASAIVYDTTAQAAKSYTYTAYRLVNGQVKQISPSLQVMTLDSTNNDFSWNISFLGDGGGSILNDVAIINDTLVYAVGAIFHKDSTGQFEVTPNNVCIWNGTNWKLSTLKFFPPGSIGDSVTGTGTAVFANNGNDIWIVAGPVYHFDGISW